MFSAFLLTAIFILLTTAVGLPLIRGGIVDKTIGMPIYIAYQIVLAAIGIYLMKKLQLLDPGDFSFKNAGKGFALGWVMLLLAALLFVSGLTSPPSGGFITPDPLFLIIVILYPFIVSGLFEEVVFRGIVLKILLKKMGGTKKGIINALIVSALFFAVVHSVHLLWDTPLTVFSDVVIAAAGGIFFGAIYLRAKTLIAPILLHGFFNLFASMIWWAFTAKGPESVAETTPDDLAAVGIAVLPLLIAAFVLLRKVRPEAGYYS